MKEGVGFHPMAGGSGCRNFCRAPTGLGVKAGLITRRPTTSNSLIGVLDTLACVVGEPAPR